MDTRFYVPVALYRLFKKGVLYIVRRIKKTIQMKTFFALTFLCFALNLNAQIDVQTDEYGNAFYSVDMNQEDAKFCVSELFSVTNPSEHGILFQKVFEYSSQYSWNNAVSKNFITSAFFAPNAVDVLDCVDEYVLPIGSLTFSYTPRKTIKTTINGDKVIIPNTNNPNGLTLNCKIKFKSKTEYNIYISDIYFRYAVKQGGMMNLPKAMKIEFGALVQQSKREGAEKLNIFVELVNDAINNCILSLKEGVSETVHFLN